MWLTDGALTHLRDVAEWPDLGGRYLVTRRLGRGGMGVVYAARDHVLDREVAVKVLDGADVSPDAADRFRDEARILARLEHPGVVPVHDIGTLADGRVFYVMKLVRGERLDVALAARRSLAERLDVFLRICDAVAFAHAQGIVHCDLKPQNIMLGSFGEALVLDWGVARVLGDESLQSRTAAGTPGFMAPEQEAGGEGGVDVRADVFALGVLLEGLLTAPVPRPLGAIAARARAAHAANRYATVAALVADVQRCRDGEPVSAYRETLVERLGRVYRRHRLPILLVLAYMLMRVIILVWQGI